MEIAGEKEFMEALCVFKCSQSESDRCKKEGVICLLAVEVRDLLRSKFYAKSEVERATNKVSEFGKSFEYTEGYLTAVEDLKTELQKLGER